MPKPTPPVDPPPQPQRVRTQVRHPSGDPGDAGEIVEGSASMAPTLSIVVSAKWARRSPFLDHIGTLLLNDVWHPWWRATVDGKSREILKADVIFRAVSVPPGRHMVRFTFHPLAGAFARDYRKAQPRPFVDGLRRHPILHIHVRPARSILSNALNLRCSAIAALVCSP